jgi:1-deoxy-D-xylulose-5-phosphate reductoisomerase
MNVGGTAPAVLNAADEIAVAAFLEGKIPFTEIPKLIETTLAAHENTAADSIDRIIEADRWARQYAQERVA